MILQKNGNMNGADMIFILHQIGATPEGIEKAVENTGQSVVEATFTTMGGVFSGVIISFYRTQFVGLRNFFALIITLVLFSLLMAVFALPSFYHAS